MKKGALRNFAEITGKHLWQSLFFNKVARPATLLKKRIWHRFFPVDFAKFLATPFYGTPLDDCFWQTIGQKLGKKEENYKNLIILITKKEIKVKWKAFFIIFKILLLVKNKKYQKPAKINYILTCFVLLM